MKKILIFILFFMLLISSKVFAKHYIVVNQDGSIHTIAEKDNDILTTGQRRYILNEWPKDYDDNRFYYWNGQEIKRKPVSEINDIKDKYNEKFRKYKVKQSFKELKKIEEIEKIDKGNWQEEKAKWQKILDENIIPK